MIILQNVSLKTIDLIMFVAHVLTIQKIPPKYKLDNLKNIIDCCYWILINECLHYKMLKRKY